MSNKASAWSRQGRASNADTTQQFDAAFLEHWHPIHRVLVRLVGDRAEAEDLALETFWRLYQHFPLDALDFNFGGWLYRVATNLGLNALRSRQRRQARELQAGAWDAQSAAQDPAQALVDREESELVRLVLGEMDSRKAQLLLLRHSGMSYEQVANVLGCAPASVGTLLARAEREFEERFRQKGE